jgi:hypothetical protein
MAHFCYLRRTVILSWLAGLFVVGQVTYMNPIGGTAHRIMFCLALDCMRMKETVELLEENSKTLGLADRLSPAVDAKLAIDIARMGFDGGQGDI